VAHGGGWAGLSEFETLVNIRILSVEHWDKSGTVEEIKARTLKALEFAQEEYVKRTKTNNGDSHL